MITDLLDQIDRLDQQATPGPWIDEDNALREILYHQRNELGGYAGSASLAEVLTNDADAKFIALARDAMPKLAKALQAVLAKCASMERGVGYRVSGQHDTWDSYHEGMSDMAGYIEEAITDTLGDDDA